MYKEPFQNFVKSPENLDRACIAVPIFHTFRPISMLLSEGSLPRQLGLCINYVRNFICYLDTLYTPLLLFILCV